MSSPDRPQRSPEIYLKQIQDRIERMRRTAKQGREQFLSSEDAQDAIIRNLEIIGEIVKRLPKELTTQYPDIPWRQIAGFRDVAIHNYDALLIEEIWNIVEHDLDLLAETITNMLRSIGPSDS